VAGSETVLHWAPSAGLADDLITDVYVDGFNLHYGALRNTPFRWLNPEVRWQILPPKNHHREHQIFHRSWQKQAEAPSSHQQAGQLASSQVPPFGVR
jgi:hypothetical protein